MRLSDLMKKNRDRVPDSTPSTSLGAGKAPPDKSSDKTTDKQSGAAESSDSPAAPAVRPAGPDFAKVYDSTNPPAPSLGGRAGASPDKSPGKSPNKPERRLPYSGQPRQRQHEVESFASSPDYRWLRQDSSASAAVPSPMEPIEEKDSLYDTMPSAIYQAAEQLKIPIPENRRMTLHNVEISLSKIIAKAIDPMQEKEGLWPSTQKLADDVSIMIALDSNFAQMTRRQNHEQPHQRLIYHSINTAVIAIDLARNIDSEHSPHEIGSAALLHDVGLAALGVGKTWDHNDPVFRSHVAKGVEILAEMKVPEAIRTMVAQHHERINGAGYPAGISGKEFLVSSQILAFANVFEDIMGGSYQHQSGEDSVQENCVQETLRELRGGLSPDVLKAFISLRGFYPNDTMVELTNRSICLVIKQNDGFPLRPVVQVIMDSAGNHPEDVKIIDLRSNTSISIIQSVSQNE